MKVENKSNICAVSACLLGKRCRYDGKVYEPLKDPPWEGKTVIAICPESAGGLPIPRTPSEIVGGDGKDVLDMNARVLSKDGEDRTREYLEGARICLEKCLSCGVTEAYLKSKSPSCGVGRIYDGTHKRRLIAGDGVFAAMLKRNGIEVHEQERDSGNRNFPGNN